MISNIDIQDWEMSPEAVKLYEVKRNSVVSPKDAPLALYAFFHIDGMYSYCQCTTTNEVVHLFAGTDVFVWSEK